MRTDDRYQQLGRAKIRMVLVYRERVGMYRTYEYKYSQAVIR